MLKDELKAYLKKVYPDSKIESPESLIGKIHLRFELGGELENSSTERIAQSTNRALEIFNETFKNSDNEILVVIYQFPEPNAFNASNKYLHLQFEKRIQTEILSNNIGEIILRKLKLNSINVKNIFEAIANTEMGFKPAIDQKIYFFDLSKNLGFHMYDDRGCFVWSDKSENIKDIFLKLNDWIVDFHRAEIEQNFK